MLAWLCNQVVGGERRYSHDSDSDEDIPDELRADYVDERTGDMPSPQKRWVATSVSCLIALHFEVIQTLV